MSATNLPRVLAIASGGGHWVQLRRIVAGLKGVEVVYATTLSSYRSEAGSAPFHVVQDASRWERWKLLKMIVQVAWLVLRVRPDVVITTGAAPGFVALLMGRLLRARTVWIDSIANADEVSMSGRRAGRIAHLWLTQWPHLATPEGPFFCGTVFAEPAAPAGMAGILEDASPRPSPRVKTKVVAIASGGGHWVELRRITQGLRDVDVRYITTQASYRGEVGAADFHVVIDANRWDRLRLLLMVLGVAWHILRIRPKVIMTTGAAPGYVAMRMGKLIGAKTVWIDSMANVDELSLSGQKAGKHVDLWLTQWPHLARPDGPHYCGAVL